MAIDELVLEAFEGDCNIQPPNAQPSTTPATTTTPQITTPTPNPGSCDFQNDECGWQISAKDENFFPWTRTNGRLLREQGKQPYDDRTGSEDGKNGHKIFSNLSISSIHR